MSSKAIGYANRYVRKTGNKDAEMFFSVDSPTAFAEECGITFIEQKSIFAEARKMLKKRLTLYTRIAMKIVDEGSRTGYILHYRL